MNQSVCPCYFRAIIFHFYSEHVPRVSLYRSVNLVLFGGRLLGPHPRKTVCSFSPPFSKRGGQATKVYSTGLKALRSTL